MILAMSYARALLESGKDSGLSDADLLKLEAELESFVRAATSTKEGWIALTGPATSPKEKADITAAIAAKLGLHPTLSRFLNLVAHKDRLGSIAEIHEALGLVRAEMEGSILGRVVSADPLEMSDVESLARSFSTKLGKKVVLKASVNPDLLAGARVTVSGVTYDGTLRAQLNQLKDRLLVAE